MQRDSARTTDAVAVKSATRRGGRDDAGAIGHGTYRLIGPDGVEKQAGTFHNLITDHGDLYNAQANAGLTPAIPTGMRLGTGGATAVAKNGAGAAIVTYVTASNKAYDGAATDTDLGAGLGHRATRVTTWAAGEATANGIDEVVVTDETPLTNVAGVAGDTLSRAILAPVVNKGASDTLEITYHHDFNGA